MRDKHDTEQLETLRLISEVLKRHGDAAFESRPAEKVAEDWLDAGFEDAEEVDEWLSARCFSPRTAYKLDSAGFTPEQASIRTTEGEASDEDTIGYKVARGDLSIDEARRIITREFWHK